MLKADLRILQRMAKILGFDLHEDGSLLIASNIVLIDEVYVFLAILILRNYKAAFFNTGFDFCKDSVNLFQRVVLIVMWIQGSLTPQQYNTRNRSVCQALLYQLVRTLTRDMASDRHWITARSHILESISNHGSSVAQFGSASSDPRRSAGGGPAPLQSPGRRACRSLATGQGWRRHQGRVPGDVRSGGPAGRGRQHRLPKGCARPGWRP